MRTKKFWLVWGDRCLNNTPTIKHNSFQAAKAEAERLALKHPGFNYYLLEAIKVSYVRADITEPLEDE